MKDEIEDPRGFHELGQRLAVAGGETGFVVLQLDGRESRAHLFELIQIGYHGERRP